MTMQTPDPKKPSTPPPHPTGAPKGPPPGVPATTAASTTPTNGAANDKPEDKDEGGSDETKEANRSKFFIVVGEVHEFPTAAKAEAFLNQPNAPKQFGVIRGHRVESKQKVTLR